MFAYMNLIYYTFLCRIIISISDSDFAFCNCICFYNVIVNSLLRECYAIFILCIKDTVEKYITDTVIVTETSLSHLVYTAFLRTNECSRQFLY